MGLSTVIGSLIFKIGSDTTGLGDGAKDADKFANSISKSITSITGPLIKYTALIVTAGAAMAVAMVKNSLDAIDAASKLSRQIGGTTAGVQSLGHAADLAGISQEALRASMQALNQRMGEAARTASGPAYEALRRLGLEANSLSKLDADEKMAVIADRMEKLGMSSSSAASTLKDLGIRSKEMVSLLEAGGGPIRAARKELEALGATVSDVDAIQIEQANDAWTKVKAAMTGIANQVAVYLAPILREVAEYLVQAAKDGQGFGKYVEQGVKVAIMALADVQKAIYDIRIAWDEFFKLEIKWSPPEWMVTLGLVKKEIELVNVGAGTLRDTLAKPPSGEEWVAWYEQKRALRKKEAEEEVKSNEERKGRQKEQGLVLTEEETKKYAEKLLRLQQSVAAEDEVLVLQYEKQLKDLADFESKKIITTSQAQELRAKIEEKHRERMNDLVWSSVRQGAATEMEIMIKKYDDQLKLIKDFETNHTITAQEAMRLREAYAQEHQLKMLELYARGASGLTDIVSTSMTAITDIFGSEGDKQFGIVKAITVAMAMVKGFEAALNAYTAGIKFGAMIGNPIVGQSMGATFAAIAAAGTAATIAKIAGVGKRQMGGPVSAGTPYLVGEAGPEMIVPNQSGNVIPQSQVGSEMGGRREIIVSGLDPDKWFKGADMRGLIRAINEEVKLGAVLKVSQA